MFRRLLKVGKKDDPSKKEPLINSDDPEAVEVAQSSSTIGASPFDSKKPATKSAEAKQEVSATNAVTSETHIDKQQQQQQQPAPSLENTQSAASGAAASSGGETEAVATSDANALQARGDESKNPDTALSQEEIVSLQYSHDETHANPPDCSEILQDIENFARDVKDGAFVIAEGQMTRGHPTKAADSSDEIETKIPMFSGFPAIWARITAVPALVKVGAVLAALASVVAVAFMLPHNRMGKVVSYETNITVAFVGSSLLFVNDIPRLVEAISGQHVVQNSCLHARGSLSSILLTGNGLYYRWRTDNAILEQSLMSNGRWSTIYDLGACTVPQLLFGHDNDISYANQNGLYYNDGNNPCIKDYMYYRYTKSLNATDWNFVVLNEQTKRMAVSNARSASVTTLENYYAPMLKNISAIPIIVQPHAYWSDSSNMTGLSDVATFTSLIYQGTEEYAVALKDQLPSSQTPRVAPVGLAFLVIYEENHDLWEQLFGSDGIHASLFGSYVIGLCLYATMYGKMPPKTYALPENIETLWSKARKLQEGGGYPSSSDYPTADEAAYLYDVVDRVNIKKYKPSTLDVSG
jgi:uncharacterized protein YcfL